MPEINISNLIKEVTVESLSPISANLSAKFIKDMVYHLQQYEQNLKKNNPEGQIAALKAMYQAIEHVEIHESSNKLAGCEHFSQLKGEVVSFIQQTLKDIDPQSDMHPVGVPRSPLSELIANMSPKKMESLLAILAKDQNDTLINELGELYNSNDNSIEAIRYKKFFERHSISFLGGGNSKNFKVENIETGEIQVLKVDNRLGMPRNIEQHLRREMSDVFIPNYAERQVECNIVKRTGATETISRTILVTDFCAYGSVDQYVEKAQTDDEKIIRTLDVATQMANKFIDIEKASCFFPDAKLTNWLIGKNGEVILADTKSFVFTDSNGNYSREAPGNENTLPSFIRTPRFDFVEFYGKEPINADKAHAALLGCNLFASLTSTMPPPRDFTDDDFNLPIFKTEQGIQLKELIGKLCAFQPSDRISIAEAKAQLIEIQFPGTKEVMDKLNKLSIGSNDTQMQAYIEKKLAELKAANPEDRAKIISGMHQIAEGLNQKINNEIIDNIVQFRANGQNTFAIGANKKADRIETAYKQIPIEERAQLASSSDKRVDTLKLALASNRHFWRRDVTIQNDGMINEENAANSFKNMRNKFQQIKQDAQYQAVPEKEVAANIQNTANSFKNMKNELQQMKQEALSTAEQAAPSTEEETSYSIKPS